MSISSFQQLVYTNPYQHFHPGPWPQSFFFPSRGLAVPQALASLYLLTLREIATCVVTEKTPKRLSAIGVSAIGTRSFRPSDYNSRYLIDHVAAFFPEAPKAFCIARAASLWLRSSPVSDERSDCAPQK